MPVRITCKFEKSDKKQQRKGGDTVFPSISQQMLSIAMETRVFIQSVPKPYATFPLPEGHKKKNGSVGRIIYFLLYIFFLFQQVNTFLSVIISSS